MTLRPGWPEDAAAVTQALAHESVVMNLSRVPWPYMPADARDWLAIPRGSTDVTLLIHAHDGPAPGRSCPRLIGTISLDRERGDAPELGYWLTPSAWGRGYATEAGRAVLHMARHSLGLKRLRARHFVDNPASGRVLGKLGFHETGRGTTFSRARGREVASVMLACDLEDARIGDQALSLAA
ncbi:GNAT family N-acetyltransferase [Sphingomonas sp. NFR15]|uniref:GNAT family N-acetyltransferase n=1 Tax=Sphingomonas sp. NFR15 TaxID=1566282 RepID=UPI000B816347|nr:GNAT family N-acetyltransferase [Sphingomonas sp. NFR15]